MVGSEMAGVGHAFAETEKPKIAEWLEKVALAGAVIWNGGSPDALRRQTFTFSTWLKSKMTT